MQLTSKEEVQRRRAAAAAAADSFAAAILSAVRKLGLRRVREIQSETLGAIMERMSDDGMTDIEIAAETGLPRSTVGDWLRELRGKRARGRRKQKVPSETRSVATRSAAARGGKAK